MQEELLPLFPLRVVLFPRTPLPLHIFEERYKEMIGEAIRNNHEFGVVLAREKGIVDTGCTAVVEKVLKRYPDGRLDILTMGRRRFEILLLNDEKTYLRGAVNFFDDEEPGPASQELRQRALEAYQALQELDESPASQEPAITDPQLSFQVAQLIPDLDFRQLLLASRSEPERMKHLAKFLPDYVTKHGLESHLKRVAPLNGRGRWTPPSSDSA